MKIFFGLDDYTHRVDIYEELFLDAFFLGGITDKPSDDTGVLNAASSVLRAYGIGDKVIKALEGTWVVLHPQEMETARRAMESMWNEGLQDYIPVSPYSEVARWQAMHPPLPVRVLRSIGKTMSVLSLLQAGAQITGAAFRELALYDCLDEMAALRCEAIGAVIDQMATHDGAIKAGYEAASARLVEMSQERHRELKAILAGLETAQGLTVDIGVSIASIQGAFTSTANRAIALPLYLSYKSYGHLRGKIYEAQRAFAALTLYCALVDEVLQAHQTMPSQNGSVDIDQGMSAITDFRLSMYFAWKFYEELRAAHSGLISWGYFALTDFFVGDPAETHAKYMQDLAEWQGMCANYLQCTRPPYYLARAQDPLAWQQPSEEWTWIRELLLPRQPEDEDQGKLDVVFCIDVSGSMSDDIEAVKDRVDEILAKFEERVTKDNISLHLGLVTYTQHEDQDWIQATPLTGNTQVIRNAIKNIQIVDLALGRGGNEDTYGAVMYAMNEPVGGRQIEMGWRGEKKGAAVQSKNPAATGTSIDLGDVEGAAKVIITMGDEPQDDPDWEDRRLADVARVAENLDPVHIYPIVLPKEGSGFLNTAVAAKKRIAEATGGQLITVNDAAELPDALVSTLQLTIRRHREEIWRQTHPPYLLYGMAAALAAVAVVALAGVLIVQLRQQQQPQ